MPQENHQIPVFRGLRPVTIVTRNRANHREFSARLDGQFHSLNIYMRERIKELFAVRYP
jgi:hypothetical protein